MSKIVSAIFVFVLLLNCSITSLAASEALVDRAKKYYYGQGVSKNINTAFRLYLKAAQQGSVDAMFVVGGLYMTGHGTAVNRPEAFKWLYNAAINGRSSKESQRILGQFFMAGNGVPQNYEEALHWYTLAAEGGDSEAQSELAYIYFSGKNIEQDYEQASYWFNIAAKNGYPLAQYNMGILWYTGNGVSGVDTEKAYAWFSLSAANGNASGESAKAFIATILSEEELKSAQEYAMQLYRKIKSVGQVAR
jgi:TPR repeat protein